MNKLTVNDMKTILQKGSHAGANVALKKALRGKDDESKPIFPPFLPLTLAKQEARDGTWPLLESELLEAWESMKPNARSRRTSSEKLPPVRSPKKRGKGKQGAGQAGFRGHSVY